MKFILMIYLFYQSGSTVELASVMADKAQRYTREQCDELERTETRTLPLQPGNDARWQYATCVQVES